MDTLQLSWWQGWDPPSSPHTGGAGGEVTSGGFGHISGLAMAHPALANPPGIIQLGKDLQAGALMPQCHQSHPIPSALPEELSSTTFIWGTITWFLLR